MKILHIMFLAGILIVVVGDIAQMHSQDDSKIKQMEANPTGLHDFDFLVGEWRAHHRRLKPNSDEWVEFDGTVINRSLMDSGANIEEHALNAPNGAYRAVALRSYDAKTGEWAIWWLDGRYPSGPLGSPVKGRFENGVGRFYSDYTQDGKSMRVRFLWSNITSTSARWEQASSADGGKTWIPNWIYNLQREVAAGTSATAVRSGAHDFDFLVGEWRVYHRYLRVKENSREWVDVEGTMSHRPLMGGSANMEEHTIHVPNGPNRAIALRSYDPKASHWSIWWLDGRAPHAIDSPVQGRFEKGVGTFYGDTTIDGKPMRVRFIWSQITHTSARWEQAFSADSGKTWEINWIMEFRRARMESHAIHGGDGSSLPADMISLTGAPSGTTSEPAPTPEERQCCAIFELRQYTLKDGQRDVLIELFDREFVETQEATGMRIYGQFRDADRPNRFVWIRAFTDMEVRRLALTSFYSGPVWKAHGKQAALTMIDSNDVLLLRPVEPPGGFNDLPTMRAPAGAAPPSSLVVATIYSVRPDAARDFPGFFRRRVLPSLRDAGIVLRAAFKSEHAPNTYPALPVREREEVFVWFASFDNREAHARSVERLERSHDWKQVSSELKAHLQTPPQQLRLQPTGRSLLR
jgi:hypothetical protein